MGTLDRVAQIQKSAIALRLDKGAAILGRLWREGKRCQSGWAPGCLCGEKVAPGVGLKSLETEFCDAKKRWVKLYIELYPESSTWVAFNEPYAVIEAMSIRQARSTGLTFLVKNDLTPKPIKIGPKGTDWKTLVDLAQLDGDDQEQAIAAVLMIQGVGL